MNIHLRARSRDRAIINLAADVVGVHRSRFMLASVMKEAENGLLDQSTIHAVMKAFQRIIGWMAASTSSEVDGMERLHKAAQPR